MRAVCVWRAVQTVATENFGCACARTRESAQCVRLSRAFHWRLTTSVVLLLPVLVTERTPSTNRDGTRAHVRAAPDCDDSTVVCIHASPMALFGGG